MFLVSAEQILPADDRGASRFLQSLLKGEMLLAPALTPVMPHYTQVAVCFRKMYEMYSLKQPGFELLYKSLKATIEKGQPLDLEVANVVASVMKRWAIEQGATDRKSVV